MRLVLAILVLLSVTGSALAHEYWLEPDRFFVNVGEKTNLRLFVGEALQVDEERVYQASKTNVFQMVSSSGIFDIRSMADDDKAPVLKFSADSPGTFLFSMERNWSYIKLAPKEFEDYLREDDMEYIVADRKRRGESNKEGSERYSRYLKTFVQVGDRLSGAVTKRLSTRLEIVPLDNPYSKKAGDTIKVQIWFDRRPLSDTTVFIDNSLDGVAKSHSSRTDKDGIVLCRLDGKGTWLVRLVKMVRCEKNCDGADWESFWGAMTFGVR